MYLPEHYNNLYNESLKKIKTNDYQVDHLIDDTTDNRRGITLLIRPDQNTKDEIQLFLNKLKTIEPKQYFYPNTDIHITLMSIISCYAGFDMSQINIESYLPVIQNSINRVKPFYITFKGITMSSSCVMIQGFISDNNLDMIRENLRKEFYNTDIQQTIDKRYTIQTAHSSVFRLKHSLQNKTEYLQLLERYKAHNFGTFLVDSLELVYNDWYQREAHVKKLFEFPLK